MAEIKHVSCPSEGEAQRGRLPSPVTLYAINDLEYGLFFRPDDKAPLQERCHRYCPGENDWLACLERVNPEVIVSGWTTSPLPEVWLQREDCALRYVCHLTGSVRALIPRSFLERGGLVTNWGNAAALGVAEHALLLALMALRNQGNWGSVIEKADASSPPTYQLQTRTLYGQQVGIYGYGRVARQLISLLRPFGVTIYVYTAGLPIEAIASNGLHACASLHELFAKSSVLFECEALTPDNAGSVSAEVLACLQDDSVFVNVGRGQLVDEQALLRELASGRIRVALDVIQEEPVSATHALLLHKDAIISPHIAGPTADRYRSCALTAFNNLNNYMSGKMLENVVTLGVYDRST